MDFSIKGYGRMGIIYLSICKIFTLLVYNSCRIVRLPIFIRGKRYIDFGRHLTTGVGCRIEAIRLDKQIIPNLQFGINIQLNDYVHICAINNIKIGNETLIASHVYISDNSHGYYKGLSYDSSPDIPPVNRHYYSAPVRIGKRVWIGEGAIVMPGVDIGDGCIIGAHSIVNRSIPKECIAVGSPIKIKKKYNNKTNRWEKTNPDGSFLENNKS